jgi:hypothetical protein
MTTLKSALCALALTAAAVPLAAQAPAPATDTSAAVAPQPPKLVFEREVFDYPGAAGRRDPFRPLTGREDVGPLFQDFKLKVILYLQGNPARSVASIQDGRKLHRVRRGDVIGNATVLDIGPQRVLFSVEDFGLRRQEVLQLKPTTREGA